MRNFKKYVEEGNKKISANSRYDLQVTDFAELLKIAKGKEGIYQALEMAFAAGVEAGARIQAKRSGALDEKGA